MSEATCGAACEVDPDVASLIRATLAVWFSGGLRIIDVADPAAPREVGFFIPDPAGGHAAPQSNDVMLDERGLITMVDRLCGFDILEAGGSAI